MFSQCLVVLEECVILLFFFHLRPVSDILLREGNEQIILVPFLLLGSDKQEVNQIRALPNLIESKYLHSYGSPG